MREIECLSTRLLATEDEAIKTIGEMQNKFMKEHKAARRKHKSESLNNDYFNFYKYKRFF